MRNWIAGTAALGAAAVLGVSLTGATAEESDIADPAARAGRMFEKQCASCHTVPDIEIATDRAWLSQVSDTA